MSGGQRKFHFEIGVRRFWVEAENEGDCRYMVRMSELDKNGTPHLHRSRLRIGYLTGSRNRWLAEFFGSRTSRPAKSAKNACRILAESAAALPAQR